MLDTYREIETPEGVELHLRAAGVVSRSLAFSIDLSLRVLVYILLSIVLAFAGRMGQGVFLIAFFLLEWFYPVLFEMYWHGETPGKRMFGLRVVNDNGTPVGWGESLVTFAERSPRLTEVRAEELADLLTSITGAQGRAGAQRLYQMANWLVGKR
jgi:uncharacterized RDD family membrane protein YckC